MISKLSISLLFLIIFSFLHSENTHTVQRGENLTAIARRYNLTVNELKDLNNLRNDNIQAGQKLIIKKPDLRKPIFYTVVAGDNLTSIARRHNISVNDLREWNELRSSSIRINQKLIIGYEEEKRISSVTTKPLTEEVKNEPVKEVETTQPEPKREIFHIVQKGETLTAISLKYSMDLLDLVDFNKLTNFTIRPGQRIWLEDGHVTETKSETLPPNLPTITQASETGKTILTHTVKRGENLYRIALNNKITVEDLRRWNNLSSLNIREGQVLYLMDVSAIENLDELITKSKTQSLNISGKSAILPVSQVRVISDFGMRSGRLHKGIDFGGNPGDPIYAVLPGRVVFSGVQRGFGNVVIIEHENFVMTVYGHNESNLVSVGDHITQGQVIATIGSTGNASVPHLHFEYRVRGVARNPKELLTQLQ